MPLLQTFSTQQQHLDAQLEAAEEQQQQQLVTCSCS
jgi:hypothetical protein